MRAWHPIHFGNCSLASSRQRNSLNLRTQSRGDQWLQSALASIFPLRWVVCCVFKDCGFYIIKILNQRFYVATFARFYLSSATFNTYIQYNMELRYILLNTGKDQKNNAWVVGHAGSFWITRELRTQISGRCRLNPFNKCDVLSNNWPLIIGPKLIALRSRKFIACHSNPSVLNNASVLWCAKKKS